MCDDVKEVTCKQCGKTFEVQNWRASAAKYCSYSCSHLGKTTKKNVKKPRVCVGCKKKYTPTTWNQKWCGRECFRKNSTTGSKSYPKKCPTCKKDYVAIRKEQKFCSRWCSARGKGPAKKKKPAGTWSLDTLWAKVVKHRAKNRCEYCGKITTLNSHHIFSRSNMATRWDVDNGVCLCVSHHVFGTMSAHKAPIEFVEWLKEKRGELWYEQLRLKAKAIAKHVDKEQIKITLKGMLE